MEMRVNSIERGCRIQALAGAGDLECGGGNGLIDSVLVNGLDDIGSACVGAEAVRHSEPLVEPAIPSTQDSLGWVLCIAVPKGVGKRQPRRPVALIIDPVLCFPTQSVAEGKTLINFPVVLVEERSIEENRARGVLIDMRH